MGWQQIKQRCFIILYNSLLCLLLPVIAVKLYRAGATSLGKRVHEYSGFAPLLPPHETVYWLHAASVGEVRVAAPLIRALLMQWPDSHILLTTTTITGAHAAQALCQTRVTHAFAPLDCAWMVKRFLKRVKPQALLMIESERWLNYMRYCQHYQIPVVVVNARLSPRSLRRYQRFPSFFALWAQPIRQLLVQSTADMARFQALGIAPERLALTGSLKFDVTIPAATRGAGQALRAAWDATGKRPVWIAASTHQGEDELVLQAFEQIRCAVPNALLVLVPRHPQRFAEVYQQCVQQGWNVARRSASETVTLVTSVYLGDTMGELLLLFAAADVAFVGGSLVAVGGHNLLEPAALGKPCLTGSHYFNFTDITQQLQEHGGVIVVENPAQLATHVTALLQDPAHAWAMGQAALQVVEQNRGALARTVRYLETLIPR